MLFENREGRNIPRRRSQLWGCEFIGGAALGAGATGAGYEYNAYRQMQKLEEDHAAGRISGREYEERKNR